MGRLRQQIIYPSAPDITTPTLPALTPQRACSGPQTLARARDDSAAMPQANQTLPHALCAHSVHADPDLAAVIAAWPTLTESVRAHILQLIATGEVR